MRRKFLEMSSKDIDVAHQVEEPDDSGFFTSICQDKFEDSADEQFQRTDDVNDDCNGSENGQQCCDDYEPMREPDVALDRIVELPLGEISVEDRSPERDSNSGVQPPCNDDQLQHTVSKDGVANNCNCESKCDDDESMTEQDVALDQIVELSLGEIPVEDKSSGRDSNSEGPLSCYDDQLQQTVPKEGAATNCESKCDSVKERNAVVRPKDSSSGPRRSVKSSKNRTTEGIKARQISCHADGLRGSRFRSAENYSLCQTTEPIYHVKETETTNEEPIAYKSEEEESLSHIGAAAPQLRCNLPTNSSSTESQSMQIKDEMCERLVVQGSDILRNTLINNNDIASKLCEQGFLSNSDLMDVLNRRNNRTRQADFLLQLVIDNGCCKSFMKLLEEYELKIYKGLTSVLTNSNRSIQHVKEDCLLTRRHKWALKSNLSRIQSCKGTRNIITQLVTKCHINHEDEKLIQSFSNETDQMTVIYDLVAKGTVKCYDDFLDILRNTNNGNVAEMINECFENITEAEAEEKEFVQIHQDEQQKMRLANRIKFKVTSPRYGSVILEVVVDSWLDVITFLSDVKTNRMKARITQYLEETEFDIKEFNFINVEARLSYQDRMLDQKTGLLDTVQYAYCHEKEEWYWTIDNLHWCHISRVLWPFESSYKHIPSSRDQDILKSLFTRRIPARTAKECPVCMMRDLYSDAVKEADITQIRVELVLNFLNIPGLNDNEDSIEKESSEIQTTSTKTKGSASLSNGLQMTDTQEYLKVKSQYASPHICGLHQNPQTNSDEQQGSAEHARTTRQTVSTNRQPASNWMGLPATLQYQQLEPNKISQVRDFQQTVPKDHSKLQGNISNQTQVLKKMTQHACDKDNDIVIPLGRQSYNVSKFLRLHGTPNSSRLAIIDKFVQLLDTKVHITSSDPRYSHIYQGIDTIVKRIICALSKKDPYFDSVRVRQTGSITSGVKVGLPHEADYMLRLPEDKKLRTGKSFDQETLFPLVQQIVSNQLVEGLPHWIILGVKKYTHIGGICLVMKCRKSENDLTSTNVGVLVDLVPVYTYTNTTVESFNEKAEAFLSHSLEKYGYDEELCRLLYQNSCDTGLIENMIIKELPENIKRSFRVAEYLISHLVDVHSTTLDYSEPLNFKKQLRYYGDKFVFRSYGLRVLFLNLLICMRDNEIEQELKSGTLVLCLLDMVKTCSQYTGQQGIFFPILKNPLIKDREQSYCIPVYFMKPIEYIMHGLEKDTPVNVMKELSMSDSKWKVYER